MMITHAARSEHAAAFQHPALAAISPGALRSTVEALDYPRHYAVNPQANREARDWIREELRCTGYEVTLQGTCDNVIASPRGPLPSSLILLGAHYDTVPTTPGADDNSSAIAVCLETAKVLSLHAHVPVMVAIFNREEDGLIGSREFVASLSAEERKRITETHIFEMVGYFSHAPRSQSKPGGLPIPLPSVGDFIGLVSNSMSNRIATRLLRASEAVSSATPVISLKTFFGIEKVFGDLLRSDHRPFWDAGLPAIMWTDTSNFRNPNYHLPSDTPDTLDYSAMADVTSIIVGHVLVSAGVKTYAS